MRALCDFLRKRSVRAASVVIQLKRLSKLVGDDRDLSLLKRATRSDDLPRLSWSFCEARPPGLAAKPV
jgi:hypothetical protein